MDALFTLSNTRKIRIKYIEYVSQQPLGHASRSVPYFLNNEKTILLSQHAPQRYKNTLKHVRSVKEQNQRTLNKDNTMAVFLQNIFHVKIWQ